MDFKVRRTSTKCRNMISKVQSLDDVQRKSEAAYEIYKSKSIQRFWESPQQVYESF